MVPAPAQVFDFLTAEEVVSSPLSWPWKCHPPLFDSRTSWIAFSLVAKEESVPLTELQYTLSSSRDRKLLCLVPRNRIPFPPLARDNRTSAPYLPLTDPSSFFPLPFSSFAMSPVLPPCIHARKKRDPPPLRQLVEQGESCPSSRTHDADFFSPPRRKSTPFSFRRRGFPFPPPQVGITNKSIIK